MHQKRELQDLNGICLIPILKQKQHKAAHDMLCVEKRKTKLRFASNCSVFQTDIVDALYTDLFVSELQLKRPHSQLRRVLEGKVAAQINTYAISTGTDIEKSFIILKDQELYALQFT